MAIRKYFNVEVDLCDTPIKHFSPLTRYLYRDWIVFCLFSSLCAWCPVHRNVTFRSQNVEVFILVKNNSEITWGVKEILCRRFVNFPVSSIVQGRRDPVHLLPSPTSYPSNFSHSEYSLLAHKLISLVLYPLEIDFFSSYPTGNWFL